VLFGAFVFGFLAGLLIGLGWTIYPRHHRKHRPVAIRLLLPIATTKEGTIVAVVQSLSNDLQYTYGIITTDQAGNPTPPPADAVFAASVTTGNASSYGVSVVGGSVLVVPLVQKDSTVATISVVDQTTGDNLATDVLQCTIGPGTPANITLGTPTTVSQPVPPNPGPG
jgi:hypothetical protein